MEDIDICYCEFSDIVDSNNKTCKDIENIIYEENLMKDWCELSQYFCDVFYIEDKL